MSWRALIVIASVLAAAALLLIWIYASLFYQGAAPALPVSFTVSGHTFGFSAYAVTPEQQERGLMNQTVSNKTFMLFAFQNSGTYPFWMYNTYYSLDIMWLNDTKAGATVVYIAAGAPPCLSSAADCENQIYTPNAVANYVIEAQAGFARQYDIIPGTHIAFNMR